MSWFVCVLFDRERGNVTRRRVILIQISHVYTRGHPVIRALFAASNWAEWVRIFRNEIYTGRIEDMWDVTEGRHRWLIFFPGAFARKREKQNEPILRLKKMLACSVLSYIHSCSRRREATWHTLPPHRLKGDDHPICGNTVRYYESSNNFRQLAGATHTDE